VAILLIWRHYEAAGQQTSAARRIFPKVQTDRLLWPTDHTWIWAVDMPPDGQKRQYLSVVARAVHAPLPAKESPAIRTHAISKQESQTTLSFGHLGTARDTPAMVCVQLIDLGEVAIPANSSKESLRLLLALQKDGAEIRLPNRKGTLAGDFAGCVENEGQWKDGELHLMNIFVKTEDGLTTFDLVVVCSEQAPDARTKSGTSDTE
jgi:hypothetical protein